MMSSVKKIVKTIAILSTSLYLVGCVSQGGDASGISPQQEQEETQQADLSPEAVSDLMGELETVLTVEQANEFFGMEGEKVYEQRYDTPSDRSYAVSRTITDYVWDLNDDVSVKGSFTVYDADEKQDKTHYETKFKSNQVKDKTDFSGWDEIDTRLKSKEGLSYDELVELLGGIEGLKSEVNTTGEITYYWYDDGLGYLWSKVDDKGMCGTTSAWF